MTTNDGREGLMAGEANIIDQVLDLWHRADKVLSLAHESRAKAEAVYYEANSLFIEVDALLDTLQREVDKLPAEAHDRKLNAVITEQGTFQ